MTTNLKSLIGRLDDTCRNALESAAGLCLSRANYDVDIEHYLLKLCEPQETDFARILNHYDVDLSNLEADLARALDQLKAGNTRTPSLSPRLIRLLEAAWMLASIEYGAPKVRSGHLLLALMTDDDLARLAREISKEFTLISAET